MLDCCIILIILASIFTAEEANAYSTWPSPEQLKGRIIIRVCYFIFKHFPRNSSGNLIKI